MALLIGSVAHDHQTDNLGYGEPLRKKGNQDVLKDKMTFR